MKIIFKLLRINHYVKNLFIFLPLFFAQKIGDIPLLIQSGIIFLAFSLVASSVYIFNDYFDINEDKKHEVKKNRPLASGKISSTLALIIMAVCSLSGISLAFILNYRAFILILVYIFLNIFYTIKLKQIAIVDCFIIATGFVLRIFIGGAIGDIRLSMWIVLITFLLTLFLALSKRRDDVNIFIQSGEKVRKVIDGYSLDFLNISMTIMATVTLVSYIMYTVSPDVAAKAGSENLYTTSIFVLLGILRYLQISIVFNRSGSPTDTVLKDRFLQTVILAWLISFAIILYY